MVRSDKIKVHEKKDTNKFVTLYLCQVQVVLLHVHQVVPDQKLHCLDVVLVLVATFN